MAEVVVVVVVGRVLVVVVGVVVPRLWVVVVTPSPKFETSRAMKQTESYSAGSSQSQSATYLLIVIYG